MRQDDAPSPSVTIEPRWYQEGAVDATYDHIRTKDTSPCIVIPTGGGKTLILATFARDVTQLWGRRILIVSHVRELLEQTEKELKRLDPSLPVGMFSAGVGRKDMGYACTLASVQTIYKRMFDFDPFDLIAVDEAHLIPPEGDGMYRKMLADAKLVNPAARLVGLTATPYRLSSGPICAPENFLNEICYEVGVRELIQQGYLCRLVSRSAVKQIGTEGVRKSGGEFLAKQIEAVADPLLQGIVAEAIELCRGRKSCLVFAAGKENGAKIATLLDAYGERVAEVYGDTLDGIRDDAVRDFKAGKLRWLVNVNVLTTGFDATNVDAVVCMRPTASMGLWSQMVGRGLRNHPGKTNCLILDYGGNLDRHGPIDLMEPEKKTKMPRAAPTQTCPECRAVIAAAYAICPECEFKIREKAAWTTPPAPTAATGSPISNEIQHYEVEDVEFSVYRKRGWKEGEPETMLVCYKIGWQSFVREWVCFEHSGFAGDRAYEWWRTRSDDPCPTSAAEGVRLANSGAVAATLKISVNHHDKNGFERIVKYTLGPKPERCGDNDEYSDRCNVCDGLRVTCESCFLLRKTCDHNPRTPEGSDPVKCWRCHGTGSKSSGLFVGVEPNLDDVPF